MVETAAATPRSLGLAPKSSDLFKTDADRVAARAAMLREMNAAGDGKVALNEWIEYAVGHIAGKAAAL